MSRKIVVTSGKGGVGKTTITANLGRMLARKGHRTIVLDLDIGLNNLDVVMGAESDVTFDIIDVLENRCRLKQAFIQDDYEPLLYLLPSSHLITSSSVNTANIKNIIDTLCDGFEYILFDCPAGIDAGFHRAVFSADEAIVVTTSHLSALRDADKVIRVLSAYDIEKPKLILNRARGDLVMNGEMIDEKQVEEILNCEIVGIIPDSDNLQLCSRFFKDDENYIAFNMLADNIIHHTKYIFDYKKKWKGIFGKLKRNIRRSV